MSFFTLPTEIRLQIYDCLLVPRYNENKDQPCALGTRNRKRIMLFEKTKTGEKVIHAAILRTCSQIHGEAKPILYTKNVFCARDPDAEMFPFLRQIGLRTFSMIRDLDLLVEPWAEVHPWLRFLGMLAKFAPRLREITVGLGADMEVNKLGLGGTIPFAHALSNLNGLRHLQRVGLGGFYAESWVPYLKASFNRRVHLDAHIGYFAPPQWLPDAGTSGMHVTAWTELREAERVEYEKWQIAAGEADPA